ncbi:hypothetical protein GALL_60600 [mine drainage metagenome]|uniref:ATP-grasp domain-containing protein n=1 Tax=mine drainage metagenome TaxID=410659 RepID=A0A1J5SV13_9ZZZZ
MPKSDGSKSQQSLTDKCPTLAALALDPIVSVATLANMPEIEVPKLFAQVIAGLSEANLFMSQCHLFTIVGPHDFALEMQAKALERSTIYRIAGTQKPVIKLLALMVAGEAKENTPLDYLIEGSDIQLDLLYIIPGEPLPTIIPDHDVAIIAVCESDKTRATLDRIDHLITQWPRPVLNRPSHIQRCARNRLYQLLASIPGLVIPPTVRASRFELENLAKLDSPIRDLLGSGTYPITIRPLDSHGGHGFSKVDNAKDLADYLDTTKALTFFVSFYIDYHSADGLYRKTRIALIDGLPYICHLAISEDWIVHYQSSSMAGSAAKLAEEADCFQSFDTEFALRHRDALLSIAARLELDYAVIDCAETPDGNLLIFEIDNTSWVHATDPIEIFPYKQGQMAKVFSAFRAMLIKTLTLTKETP